MSRHMRGGLARTASSMLVVLIATMRAALAQPEAALLDPIFGEHAVLQRDRPLKVWGRAQAGESVTVEFAGTRASALAQPSGRWSALLAATPAGGPYTLTVGTTSGATRSVRDILVGDVFICSGQSNMELSVLRAADSGSEIQSAADTDIRMLTVAHASSPQPLDQFLQALTWRVAAPETVPDWSAVCFYFARELRKMLRVPVGLVHASWSGSNIRSWMSAAALRAAGGYEAGLELLPVYAHDPSSAQRRLADQWESWWRAATADAPGTEPWAGGRSRAPVRADSRWRKAPAVLGNWGEWGVPELTGFTGLVWFRTMIHLSASQAKAGATLRLGPINQVDETWINGHALGNTFGYGTERSYAIPAEWLRAGENVLVINTLSTYGGGGLLKSAPGTRALEFDGGGRIGLDGPWTYRIVPAEIGYPPRAPWESVGGLSTLYNAMIAPLGPFGVRAALWYQGESNTAEAKTYRNLLAGLMADWRRQFGADLAFLVVQLPNYGAAPTAPAESGWSDVREAQRAAVAADPNAGLAVTIDIGDAHNLHPTNKQDVARRLVRAARHVLYGEPIPPSGPVARRAVSRGREIAIEFGDIEGRLVAYSHDDPISFELCTAAAGGCRYVDARIDGTSVILTAPEPPVTRVRYCWGDSPVCTLFDSNGLPAGPFELDIQRPN